MMDTTDNCTHTGNTEIWAVVGMSDDRLTLEIVGPDGKQETITTNQPLPGTELLIGKPGHAIYIAITKHEETA